MDQLIAINVLQVLDSFSIACEFRQGQVQSNYLILWH